MESTKTIVTNVIVTFVQAAGAVWVTSGFATDKLALSGAVGAGLSAVWNLVGKPLLKKWKWLK